MYIQSLKLLNFRNYQNISINFSPKINIFYGLNGEGKTNLVESIYFLGLTKSFRNNNDLNLIKKGCTYTKLLGHIKNEYENDYMIYLDNNGKKIKVNNENISKLSNYIGRIKIIVFDPNDLKFVKESPSIRRKILNISISQINQKYLYYLNKYNKVLKQRNIYLKQFNKYEELDFNYLDILTKQLIEYGYEIYHIRKEFITKINNYLNNYYQKIMDKNHNLKLVYSSFYNNLKQTELLKLYQDNYKRDFIFKQTFYGIHKDDFLFYLDDEMLKDWGSEGQQKNAIISFKLAQIANIKENFKENPILILDDLFSELDNLKIKNILDLLDDNIQTFITTTNIEIVEEKIKNAAKIYFIEHGNIKEV